MVTPKSQSTLRLAQGMDEEFGRQPDATDEINLRVIRKNFHILHA